MEGVADILPVLAQLAKKMISRESEKKKIVSFLFPVLKNIESISLKGKKLSAILPEFILSPNGN